MNGSMKSKRILGPALMKLTEPNKNGRNTNGLQKLIKGTLLKIIAISLSITFAIGICFVLLKILQNSDNIQSFMIARDSHDDAEINFHQRLIDFFIQLNNKTLEYSSKRIKRDTIEVPLHKNNREKIKQKKHQRNHHKNDDIRNDDEDVRKHRKNHGKSHDIHNTRKHKVNKNHKRMPRSIKNEKPIEEQKNDHNPEVQIVLPAKNQHANDQTQTEVPCTTCDQNTAASGDNNDNESKPLNFIPAILKEIEKDLHIGVQSFTKARDTECPAGSISCESGTECVKESQWCDGKVDCGDVSDEIKCGCKSRVDKSRLCDGYFDCPLGEDEMGCNGCRDNMFSCENVESSQSTCFTLEDRCNNIADCPNLKDEHDCNMLTPNLYEKRMLAVPNTEGFLHRNLKGNWYAVCKNPYMWAHDACLRETGILLRPPFIQMVQVEPTTDVNYVNTGPAGLMHTSNQCFNSSAVYVTCPDLLCGVKSELAPNILDENIATENHLFGRNKRYLLEGYHYPHPYRMKRDVNRQRSTNKKNKIYRRADTRVVGGKPSQPGAWPWMVALYRNGMFHCGGVILTDSWVMSAAHCVHKYWENYYEAQVGMLRRFSFSPQEHIHLVTNIIVNQNYDQVDMKNDLSLLKVKPSIQFSRWTRPICLPGPETAGPDWMWGPAPGTTCTAVGWGATKEHGADPDHMREVEVPVWGNCKHREDQLGKEICAGLAEGGKDACQGDSGGPLLCRSHVNPQQWYIAGIVSHGEGCGRKDEPGVYTRVNLFVKWIRFHIASKILPPIKPKQECPGFRCKSGFAKCIPSKRVCDKIIDCLDGEDEMNCSMSRMFDLNDLLFMRNAENKNGGARK